MCHNDGVGERGRAHPGLVSNLKKEFEARSEGDSLRRLESRGRSTTVEGRERPPASPPSTEDLSVKDLVDRYDRPVRARCESVPKKSRLTGEGEARGRSALRHSFCARGAERPPPAPTVVSLAPLAPLDLGDVVVSTVMSKAQTKKQLQHGKTHPLTRLNLNRSNRCSNPVYNTM